MPVARAKTAATHAALERVKHIARSCRYALKCDIRKYFPSVDHAVLLRRLGRVIGDRRLLALMDTIIGSHNDGVEQKWTAGGGLFDVTLRGKGIPIGNLTSQCCANIYLNGMDHFIKHDLRVKGHVRYLDDFVLFGDDRAELKTQGQAMKRHLENLRLVIHPNKYRMHDKTQGVDFVGFVVFNSKRVRVRRESVRRFDRRYRQMRWEVNEGRKPPAELTQSVVAWSAHVGHTQSYGLRRSVLVRPRRRVIGSKTRGSFRLLRGGSWNSNENNLRSSSQNNNNPTNENNNIGFRVASPGSAIDL